MPTSVCTLCVLQNVSFSPSTPTARLSRSEMGRYDDVEQRTDDNIDDDPAGIARIEMAAASKARRELEAADIRRKNAELKARLANIKAKTDDEMDTEDAAIARAEFAAKSKARIRAQIAQQRQHELEMQQRIQAVGPRTDVVMDNEVAAVARAELAAQSKAKRDTAEAERRLKNTETKQRLQSTESRTDAQLDTEAAALARVDLAEESKLRYKEEKAERLRWNAVMKSRISAAQDYDGTDEDAEALADLIAQKQLGKPSEISCQTYIRYKDYVEKTARGAEGRQEKEERRQICLKNQADKVARGAELAQKRLEQQEVNKRILQLREEHNQVNAAKFKAQEILMEKRKKREHAKFLAKAKERVTIARGLDTKLDAQEEAVDAEERREASNMKAQMSVHIMEARESELSARKHQVYSVREGTREANLEASARLMRESAERARQKREEAEKWRMQKKESDDEHRAMARSNRAAAMETRARGKAATAALQSSRKSDAANIRMWEAAEWDVERDKMSINMRKSHVQNSYSTRYCDEEAADEWNLSPLKRLHGAARWARHAATSALTPGNSSTRGGARSSVPAPSAASGGGSEEVMA